MKEKDWNEYKTRKEFIDRLLLNSQWNPIAEFKEGKRYMKKTRK